MLRKEIPITVFSNIGGVALTMLSGIIVARTLGSGGRGIVALALLLPTMLAPVMVLGQDSVNATFPGLMRDKRKALLQHTIWFILVTSPASILILAAVYAWSPLFAGTFGVLPAGAIWASLAASPVIVAHTLLVSMVRGYGLIVAAAWLRIAASGTTLALVATLLFLRRLDAESATWALATAALPATLVALLLLRRDLDFSGLTIDKDLLITNLRFALPVCLAAVGGVFVYRVDQLVLAYFHNEHTVGLYVVAVGMAERLKVLPASVGSVFLPRLANELTERQSQVPAVFRATIVATSLAMLLVGAIGAPLLPLLYGHEFARSVAPLLVLLPGIVFLSGSSVLASDLLARRRSRYSLITSYATLGLTLLLNLVLVPRFGIIGAACAASSSYLAGLVLWLHFYRRESSAVAMALVPRASDVALVVRVTLENVTTLRRYIGWGPRSAGRSASVQTSRT